MSAVAEPHGLKGVTPSFPGDMPPERIGEKYRLGRGYNPKARYLDPEFQALELDKLFTRTWHDYLSPVPRCFAPFQFENMRVKWWKSLRLPCNWKTALDGFLEAYHTTGTHPQLTRADKHNLNLATLREIDNRLWSPTTTYERHAHYSAVGRKNDVFPDSVKTPQARGTDNIQDPRLSFALSVQYIYDDMKGLENPLSYRAAEELKTAEIPRTATSTGSSMSCTATSRSKRALTGAT